MGFLSALGVGAATLFYFRFEIGRWETLNLLTLLWTIYVFAALGAGNAQPTVMTIIPPRPEGWRIVASVMANGAVYAVGRGLIWRAAVLSRCR